MERFGNILFQAGRGALAIALSFGLGAEARPVKSSDAAFTQTMKNLIAALNGERNAEAKYLAYAQKADEEGYGAVGSLFRAAAASEEISGDNHERAIRKLGGTPDVKLETPTFQSTAENLQAAISGESRERKSLYPFVHQARKDRYVPAIVTFGESIRDEKEHARLFEDALRNLNKLKGSGSRTYYICTVCGYATTNLNFEKCTNCLKPKGRYKPVSQTPHETRLLHTLEQPPAGTPERRMEMIELIAMQALPPIPNWTGLHPLVIHFPIALLLVTPLFIIAGTARVNEFETSVHGI